jgi:hypothetical protein
MSQIPEPVGPRGVSRYDVWPAAVLSAGEGSTYLSGIVVDRSLHRAT